MFLDRGELDKLLQVADRDDDDSWDDRDRARGRYDSERPYGALRKKKSFFLSEMFEFGD